MEGEGAKRCWDSEEPPFVSPPSPLPPPRFLKEVLADLLGKEMLTVSLRRLWGRQAGWCSRDGLGIAGKRGGQRWGRILSFISLY